MICAARRNAIAAAGKNAVTYRTTFAIRFPISLLHLARGRRYKAHLPSAGGGVRVREKKRGGPAGASCASGQKHAPRGGWARVLCGTDAAALWKPWWSEAQAWRLMSTPPISTGANDEDRWIVDLDASGVRLGEMSLLKYPRLKEASITVLLFPLMH